VGTIVDRAGQVVRCSEEKASGGCGSIAEYVINKLKNTRSTQQMLLQGQAGQRTQNTTITLVVTNQKLGYADLQRLAVQVHTSMARAIQPFHTSYDGDTLFTVTTSEVDNPNLHPVDLGVLASEVAWDAVLNSVPVLDPKVEKKFVQLDPERYAALTGRYEFGPEARLTITHENNQLFAEATGKHEIYGFQPGVKAEIFPTSDLDFFRKDPQSPHLRFVKDQEGHATGLVLNPGNWPVPARKMRE
jgi:hypothetical protein